MLVPVYSFTASDTSGQSSSGTITADTPSVGRELLRHRGLRINTFESAVFIKKRSRLPSIRQSKRRAIVCEFARQLSLLLRAGTTLTEALDILNQQVTGPFQAVQKDIRDRISSGSSFSVALEKNDGWFDDIFIGAAEVGQKSGRLDDVLSELAQFLRDREQLHSRIVNALAYPFILTTIGCLVVLFLMTAVIPQLLEILEASGRELPLATQSLKVTTEFLIHHWLLLAILGALSCVLSLMAYRSHSGRLFIQRMQFRIPLVGSLIQKSLLAQFANSVSLLLHTGVPFLEAIQLMQKGTKNLLLKLELDRLSSLVNRGCELGPVLQASVVFPPVVARIMHVGQQTGELPKMLDQLSEAYTIEVHLAVEKFLAVLEPLLIVALAIAVGYVVFATMMPILEITRSFQ